MLNRIIVFFVLILLITACKQANQVSEPKVDENDFYSGNEIQQQLKEMYHRFPSPGEMFKRLDKSKLQYRSGVVNDISKYDHYLSSKSQALNLGVYSADLAYLTLVEQHEDAASFVEAIYSLSDKLRVSAAFDRSYILRIQKNITNIDSLKVISEETYSRLTDFLESNNDDLTFAQISVGGYVETLYLTLMLTEDFSEDSTLKTSVSDQKFVLNNLFKFAQQISSTTGLSECIALIQPIKDVYDSIEVSVEETTVEKDTTGKLIIHGGEEPQMTEDQFAQLKTVVYEARKKITEI